MEGNCCIKRLVVLSRGEGVGKTSKGWERGENGNSPEDLL